MKLVFLGPPGAGKGTQARLFSEKVGISHISTGEIFRENIKDNTELGQKAAEYSNKGQLVPDEITNEMVKARLNKPDCDNGFILDGYPRTINQAKFLAKVQEIDNVLNFMLPEEGVIKRISGRRTCPNCGAVYHISFKKPGKEGVCDNCGTGLVQRKDETPEVIMERLNVYRIQTEPLIDYYEQKNILLNIDSTQSIEEISNDVELALAKKLNI